MDEKPDGFDWVTARSRCSLGSVFQILSEIVASNVKAANALPNQNSTFEQRPLNNKFLVLVRRDIAGFIATRSVVFELSSSAIDVKLKDANGLEKMLFSAKPSFVEEGDCRLEIDGQRFSLWQISRRALEDLFFGA